MDDMARAEDLGLARYDYERARVRVYKLHQYATLAGLSQGDRLREAMCAETVAADRYARLLDAAGEASTNAAA